MSGDSQRWERIAREFDDLAELAPARRESRLRELVAEDPDLAAEVRALLVADDRAEGLLDQSLDELVPELAPWETPAGLRLGAYRLVEPLGQGGMGEVWLAERADGEYRQRVAVKLLKRGIDTQAVLRRFLQERSILARLNHPSIVRLLDGGMSLDGRPWYAMEHVDGETITRWAARRALALGERVDLLAQVADAVAYAHAQLVVHRDLKPGNILVDAEGAPHLLDFGIAKLLEDTGDHTVTATGVRVLSPAYAAPEQILGEPVGTATDVYALGVLAYELFTGRLPHRRQSRDPALLAGDLDQPLERASTVVGRLAPAEIAALYGEGHDRRRLGRSLSGDLDVIVAKALQRVPERRYATAAAFADDLRRWRSGRVIAARPDSSSYRLRTFVRRHRWGVAAASGLLLALLAGFGTALWQADRARQQAQRAELVKQFVLSLFREQDPVARAQAQARTPGELVAEGIERARRELVDDPRLRLDVLADLGTLPAALGDPALSEQVLAQVLEERRRLDGENALATARVKSALGGLMIGRGNPDDIRRMLTTALDTITRVSGQDSLDAARTQTLLARLGTMTGDREDAMRLAKQAHATMLDLRGADHPETLEVLSMIATMHEFLDQLDDAAATWRKVIAGVERSLGEEHARMVVPLANLGTITRSRQDYPEAAALYARAVAIARKRLGSGHPMLGGALLRQGDVLRRMGDFEGAAAAFDEAEPCVASVPAQRAQLEMFRAAMYSAQRRHQEAVDAYELAHGLFLGTGGADSAFPWLAELGRAEELATLGRCDEAGEVLETARERLVNITGVDSYEVASAAGLLGRVRREQGRLEEALQLGQHHVEALERIYGSDHPNTSDARFDFARSQLAAGLHAEARANIDRVIADFRPGSSTEKIAADLHIESARLALIAGDNERYLRDAAKARELIARLPNPDQRQLEELAQLNRSGLPSGRD
ncbi:serine/threonine-protein kinase [Pseudofulvimonas gallinarii]|uniref:Serine/threonine-protein kinase n=1 Tax=Pseudofulvimonas gallinarii TaxID=634155 RepID=A0A4R3LIY5_9GAMM|nr:serine/threonine-protein kinase [Pseudofulvimonas gallinarii]TCS97586.1 serine/threonine-protein kinase [Pseudofulvimonas gallinarii]